MIVTDEGTAKLLDFGLALVVRDGIDDTSTMLVGTPDYMAPEVWTSAATRRSDVYSLGAVLYELLSGVTPFAHIEPSDLRRVTAAGIPGPNRVCRPSIPRLTPSASGDPGARRQMIDTMN